LFPNIKKKKIVLNAAKCGGEDGIFKGKKTESPRI
jgi:hypothetical protein